MVAHIFFRIVLRQGNLEVTDAAGRTECHGDGSGKKVAVRFHDRLLGWQCFLNPKLYVGEAFTDGRLTVETGTLYDFLEICIKNVQNVERHPLWLLFEKAGGVLRHLKSFNPIKRARRNVAHHYDLSGELYDLFLDEDRQYSCAYFDHPDQPLEEAQEDKKRHLAAKLILDRPGLKILDIGSGWGGLGLYLAQVSHANVSGVTLSTEQFRVSNARAMAAGLADRVKFELKDYRQKTEIFDRIVSVGMFEHVGSAHYRQFFRKVKELLSDDGVLVLHSIGRPEPPGTMNPWITKYIFPGGYIPALSEVLSAVEKEGLYVTDVEILRLHYAETLKAWRDRFYANREKVAKIYDERFCRMWDFYLSSCELTFRHLGQMVFQLQIAKSTECCVPLKRDYISDWERSVQTGKTQAAE